MATVQILLTDADGENEGSKGIQLEANLDFGVDHGDENKLTWEDSTVAQKLASCFADLAGIHPDHLKELAVAMKSGNPLMAMMTLRECMQNLAEETDDCECENCVKRRAEADEMHQEEIKAGGEKSEDASEAPAEVATDDAPAEDAEAK